MHQATRVRFRGGDPLALTKRIQARRQSLSSEVRHYRLEQASPEPYRETWRDHLRDAAEIVGGVAVVLLGVAALWMWAAIAAVAS